MRQIELTMCDRPGAEQCGGQRGEHRMAELLVPLPAETAGRIQSCVAVFSCDDQLVLSPLMTAGDSGDCYIADGMAHIVLWQRLTQCWVLQVQLECYSDDNGENFIDRTCISEKITFGKSLGDSTDEAPEVDDQPGVIAQLLAAMHKHGNMTVLEELGDKAHELTYRGEAVTTEALSNMEINDLINQALAAAGGR